MGNSLNKSKTIPHKALASPPDRVRPDNNRGRKRSESGIAKPEGPTCTNLWRIKENQISEDDLVSSFWQATKQEKPPPEQIEVGFSDQKAVLKKVMPQLIMVAILL